MRLEKILFTVVIVVLLSACGGGSNSSNNTPTVNAGEDKSVKINETITITGTASDSDGSIVAYEWREGSKVLADTATFDYLPTVAGNHTLTLTVTDDDGVTASDSIVVTVTSISSFNFAVLSYNDEDRYAESYSDITSKKVSALHEWSESSKEFKFNGNMLIDLGLLSENNSLVDAHKNKHSMWLGSWSTDEGYIILEFKDKDNNILHTFEYRKPVGYHDAYIALDGDKHNESDAKYQIDIYGYINIKDNKLDYDGEYRVNEGKNWCGLTDKTWSLSNYDKIKTVKVSIGVKGTYNFAGIPLYIEY